MPNCRVSSALDFGACPVEHEKPCHVTAELGRVVQHLPPAQEVAGLDLG